MWNEIITSNWGLCKILFLSSQTPTTCSISIRHFAAAIHSNKKVQKYPGKAESVWLALLIALAWTNSVRKKITINGEAFKMSGILFRPQYFSSVRAIYILAMCISGSIFDFHWPPMLEIGRWTRNVLTWVVWAPCIARTRGWGPQSLVTNSPAPWPSASPASA